MYIHVALMFCYACVAQLIYTVCAVEFILVIEDLISATSSFLISGAEPA